MNAPGDAVSRDRHTKGDRHIWKVRLFRQTYHISDLSAGVLLVIPSIVFIVFVFIFPMIRVVQLSFTNYNMATGVQDYIGLRNYEYLLENDRFWQALFQTGIFAAVKLSFETALALLIALMLDAKVPFKKFLRISYFSPVVVPVVASSLIWIWFYDPSVGPFNQILSALGIPTLRWLYHESTSLISVLIFSIWKGLGYNIILFLAGLQNISDSYVEAARIDGASSWKLFWHVKFPLLRPVTSFILMMGIINAFKVFSEVNVMTPEGGPLGSTLLMVSYIYEQAFTNGRMGRACAAAFLLFIIILILTQIQRSVGAKKTLDLD